MHLQCSENNTQNKLMCNWFKKQKKKKKSFIFWRDKVIKGKVLYI